MQNVNRQSPFPKAPALIFPLVSLGFFVLRTLPGADRPNPDPRKYLLELERLGARKPFLVDSPDVYLERRSLNHFFTEAIYRRLQGDGYFGYEYDEGFHPEGK